MDIYQTKERIEKFLEKEISILVPDHIAELIHEILDKAEGKPNGNESTTDAEPATTDEPIYESTTIPTSTDGAATTSTTESTPK